MVVGRQQELLLAEDEAGAAELGLADALDGLLDPLEREVASGPAVLEDAVDLGVEEEAPTVEEERVARLVAELGGLGADEEDDGAGEREVLALALGRTDALVLLDDALARRYAEVLGIRKTGTMGLLMKAKQRGLIPAVKPLLDDLDRLRFRLDPALRAIVLSRAGETP